MYFVVIMAFAFVLSEGLPPERMNLLRAWPIAGPFAVIAVYLIAVVIAAAVGRKNTLRHLNGTEDGHETAIDALTDSHQLLLWIIATGLTVLMLLTPWARLVRDIWQLKAIPILPDLLILAPFFLAVTISWSILYLAELRIKQAAMRLDPDAKPPAESPTGELHAGPDATLAAYLLDKFRHQILIVAAPLVIIVFAKYFTTMYKPQLTRWTHLVWISDSLLGITSAVVLLFSPVILRYVWSTTPLPPGPLRDRFVRICNRIGLRYQEILLWRTHGLAVNAAVMGFIPQLRYILVSDALLTTMTDEEIEAVFGHEAGHVQHWHLQFFGLFALVAMYAAGGVITLLAFTDWVTDPALWNLIALAVLLACWLFGFGWLSRKFERQADLYGVRCITPDIKSCPDWCPVHGTATAPQTSSGTSAVAELKPHDSGLRTQASSLCISAASLFGRTLLKIADLNGIPRYAPSWRHGSIDSRCKLLEKFTADPTALARYDRKLWCIKVALLLLALIGTAIAGYLYFDDTSQAVQKLIKEYWGPPRRSR